MRFCNSVPYMHIYILIDSATKLPRCVSQLQEEQDKLAAAAEEADWRKKKIAALEDSLQEECSAASAAIAEAQRQTEAAKAAIHAARELAAEKDRKAACMDDKMKSKATHC